MKTIFTFNFVNKTIVGSKRSIERANKGLEPEYSALMEKLAAQPTFSVKAKVINTNRSKKTYNDLTFRRMEEYITLQPNGRELLDEFETVKAVAKAKGALYPLSKKWFLAKFPDYKKPEVPGAPINKECSDEVNNNEECAGKLAA